MEGIISLVWIVGAIVLFRLVVIYGAAAFNSSAKAAFGKGTFKENLDLELHGMAPMQLRGVEKNSGEDGAKLKIIELEVKGLFPTNMERKGAFITSVFDATEGEENWESVFSTVHQFQEDETFCYQYTTDVGVIQENYGYARWVGVGVVVPDLLQPPRTGTRKLVACVRLIDQNEPPVITSGFHDDEAKLLWSGVHEFNLQFDEAGYLDELEGSREAAKASVKLAVSVAMADGTLHEREALIIQNWMQKKLASVAQQSRDSWKADLNSAFKDGFQQASSGSLSYSVLTNILSEKGSTANNTECVDLLFAIIGADAEVNASELALAKKIAAALNVDTEEVQRIADRSLIGVEAKVSSSSELEDLLGIDPSWSDEAIKKHLREQFQKWNNRLTSLTDLAERENAQRMLTLISDARKKYQ